MGRDACAPQAGRRQTRGARSQGAREDGRAPRRQGSGGDRSCCTRQEGGAAQGRQRSHRGARCQGTGPQSPFAIRCAGQGCCQGTGEGSSEVRAKGCSASGSEGHPKSSAQGRRQDSRQGASRQDHQYSEIGGQAPQRRCSGQKGSACKERCTGEKGGSRQARQPCRQGRTGPCASSPEVARCQSPCTQEPQPQGVMPFLNPTITLSASLGQCACTVCASPSCTRWIEKFNNARVLRACAC